MAFDLDVGGGQTVTVHEATRGQFSNNLGGAVQYSLARAVYKLTETMGGAMGAFAAGVAVQFLDRIEPSLVKYSKPLIEMILEIPGLDHHVREFFEQLRSPTDAGAAAVLGPMVGQAGSAGLASIINVAFAPGTQMLMRMIRPSLPSVAETFAMWRRGKLTWDDAAYKLASLGYNNEDIGAYAEITRSRAGVGDLVTGVFRGTINHQTYEERMKEYGFHDEDIDLYLKTLQSQPAVGEVIRGWFRGELDDPAVRERLKKLGYDAEGINLIMEIAHPIPGPGDLVSMGVREAWRDDIAAQWGYDEDSPPELAENMAKHGYDPEWAKRYWRAHWSLPSALQGFEMLHRDVIDDTELQTLLRALDIPSRWRSALTEIAWTPYTRVDVRRMYGLGVLDEDDVRASYRALGYDAEKAENMTQFTILYEKGDGSSTIDEYKELTRSVVIQAFTKGILDKAEATTRLMSIGYDQVDIDILLELATWTKELAETPDYEGEYAKDVKSIIERAYSRRLLSHTDAGESLTDLGYGTTEAEYLLSSVDFWYGFESLNGELKAVGDAYVSRAYNRTDAVSALGSLGVPANMQEQVLGDLDTERKHRSRRLTEAQYRRALGQNLITSDEYAEDMRGLGYSDADVWLLVNMAAGTEAAGSKPRTGEYA